MWRKWGIIELWVLIRAKNVRNEVNISCFGFFYIFVNWVIWKSMFGRFWGDTKWQLEREDRNHVSKQSKFNQVHTIMMIQITFISSSKNTKLISQTFDRFQFERNWNDRIKFKSKGCFKVNNYRACAEYVGAFTSWIFNIEEEINSKYLDNSCLALSPGGYRVSVYTTKTRAKQLYNDKSAAIQNGSIMK